MNQFLDSDFVPLVLRHRPSSWSIHRHGDFMLLPLLPADWCNEEDSSLRHGSRLGLGDSNRATFELSDSYESGTINQLRSRHGAAKPEEGRWDSNAEDVRWCLSVDISVGMTRLQAMPTFNLSMISKRGSSQTPTVSRLSITKATTVLAVPQQRLERSSQDHSLSESVAETYLLRNSLPNLVPSSIAQRRHREATYGFQQ